MSKQAYYSHLKSGDKKNLLESLIVDFVHSVRRVLSRLGCRKLWLLHLELFPKYGHAVVGRDYFFRILKRHNLLVKRKKSNKPHSTYSKHGYAVKPNMIKDLDITVPNQVYVTDVTWIWVYDRWSYLALVTDKYSRKIVGWGFREDHSHRLIKEAIDKALKDNKSHKPIILHSDRGSEFCCHELIDHLQKKGVLSSMTDADHCAQNALAERMNGIIKQEFVPVEGYASFGSAKAAISYAINLFNTARPHEALGMVTPVQVHNGNYNNKGERIKSSRGKTKSAGEVIESLLGNSPLFMQIVSKSMA